MKITRRLIHSVSALLLIILTPSCATSNRAQQELAGVATGSALVVALPLIPFAATYHIVSGDLRREKKAEQQLRELLDPVYQERIKMIEQRNPVADATQAWSSGARALLPSIPNGNIFPGLERTEFHLKQDFAAKNYAELSNFEFLRYLEQLMGKDPVHLQHANINYYSETYKQFLHTTWRYRESFNKEIYFRLQQPSQ